MSDLVVRPVAGNRQLEIPAVACVAAAGLASLALAGQSVSTGLLVTILAPLWIATAVAAAIVTRRAQAQRALTHLTLAGGHLTLTTATGSREVARARSGGRVVRVRITGPHTRNDRRNDTVLQLWLDDLGRVTLNLTERDWNPKDLDLLRRDLGLSIEEAPEPLTLHEASINYPDVPYGLLPSYAESPTPTPRLPGIQNG